MTTATAGNVAGHPDKDKEKVEKRRALGRGLASLLPGPRVLNPFAKKEGTTANTGAEAPGSALAPDPALKGPSSTAIPGGLAEDQVAAAASTKTESTDLAHATQNSHVSQTRGDPSTALRAGVGHPIAALNSGALETAELRSAGQPEAAVPTYTSSATAASTMATGTVDYDPFGDAPADGVIEIQAVSDTRVPSNLVVNLAISDIDKNPFQTRYVEDDDALEELADSIKANGVVQPIVVRPAEEAGRYILILGERRLHASKKIGKTHIPALVRRVSEQQAAEMTIVENLQREDLSPLEQAEAFRVLSNKFSLTQQEIAQRVGLSRTSITNYMRLLKLPREVMQLLAEKRLNFAQAKELLKLGENDRIAEAALYAVKKGMNIEQIEMLVLRMDGLLDPLPDMPGVQKEKKSSGARWVDPNVRSAQMDLERMLGVRVRIRDRKGRGKIVIEYSTVDDYERVVEMLRGKK
jgi:ParB family transcriptional regulator, chromosome partitioning protein